MTSLATFVDRYTMRHVRIYPHPIERVWDAITDDEQVSKWMGFEVHFPELRVGAKCVWGPLDGQYFETEIIRLEPKTLIEHGGMRFELTPHGDGCRFEFTQSFEPGRNQEIAGDLGGDLPGGPDTPWRPGFVGGFHSAFDGLGRVLDGLPADHGEEPKDPLFGAIVDEWAKRRVQQRQLTQELADTYRRQLRSVAVWNELNEIYREHIRDTIPAT